MMNGANTGFQKGDYIFVHGGRPAYLRLTLGALAEISARLDAENIAILSQKIRRAEPEDIIAVFTALSRPAHGENFKFKDLDLQTAMPALADIFETGFAPLSKGDAS